MAAGSNYIALLNELTQKKGWTWKTEVVNTEGPDHSRTFTMRAEVNDKPYPNGVGRSKKEARQNAAKNALSLLQEEEPASSETNPCSPDGFPKLTQANYTCWLNEYGQKTRLSFYAAERMCTVSNQLQNACRFVCGDKEYPEAFCKGKREAKEEAAKLVHKEIHKERETEVPDEKRNEAQQPNISELSTSLTGLSLGSAHSESTGLDNNFIGILNQYCQKTSQTWDFKLVEKTGPAHNPEFVYKVVINKNEYPEGRGKSAKRAQQRAAELAWNSLRLSNGNSQTSSSSCDSKDEPSSSALTLESEDDTSSKAPPIIQNSIHSIIFKDSPAHPQSPVPVKSPLDAKSKIRLAVNFQMSPDVKQEKPAVSNLPKPSAGIPNSPVKSSFFLAHYHEIAKLGSGGFGRVFKARNKIDQMDFAVKIVKFTEKAQREVAALAKLEHANIVCYKTNWIEETAYRCESSDSSSTSSSSSEGNFLYILMELCEGHTLQAWIENKNTLNPYPERRQEAADIMTQVLEAVKYIHSNNLIHRDLKPANIMFGKEDVVKVGDFGLVTADETDSDEVLMKRTNRTGTRSYMSPEQESKRSYNRKVDIFPLGLIYFELLWNLKTVTEREKIWKDLRNKKLPEGFSRKFTFENKLIEQMLRANHDERPDATVLLPKLNTLRTTVLQSDWNTKNENRTY